MNYLDMWWPSMAILTASLAAVVIVVARLLVVSRSAARTFGYEAHRKVRLRQQRLEDVVAGLVGVIVACCVLMMIQWLPRYMHQVVGTLALGFGFISALTVTFMVIFRRR